MKYIFSIEGNIGSGKSTIIKNLESTKELKGYTVIIAPEPVDQWNDIKDPVSGKTIIELYYSNQKQYSFSFQMMAYITRLSQLRKLYRESPENTIIITERSIYTDREIFAKMLYDTRVMKPVEYQIYNKWFDEFIEELKVDGIIYIKTSPNKCDERIHKRSRKGESSIPKDYLEKLNKYHDNWLLPVNPLIINGDVDWVNIPVSMYTTIMEYIKAKTK